MSWKRKFASKRLIAMVVAPAIAGHILTTAPAQAGWKPGYGGAVAGVTAAAGLGYSLKKNLRELLQKLDRVLIANVNEDSEEVERISREVDKQTIKFGLDAFPVLAAGSRALEASRSAAEKLSKKLTTVRQKIGRFLGDPRSALSVDDDERRWSESKGGILARKPLPAVKVSHGLDTPGHGNTASVAEEDDNSPDWGAQRSDPVGEYALRCGGAHDVSPHSVHYVHWKRLMEEHSGDCPVEDPNRSEWSEVLNESDEEDPWASDEDKLAVDRVQIDEGGRYLVEEESGEVGHTLDYQEALADLERRQEEAERQRRERDLAAEETRRRKEVEALVVAERRRQEAREYQRRAAERERRELEEELAASRRNDQFFHDSVNQSIQMINQQLEVLQKVRRGQAPAAGHGGTGSCSDCDGDGICDPPRIPGKQSGCM